MSRRSRDAWRLAGVLTKRAGCVVELRWDAYGGGPWTWWVIWSGGPSVARMRALIEELAGPTALDPAGFTYSRDEAS